MKVLCDSFFCLILSSSVSLLDWWVENRTCLMLDDMFPKVAFLLSMISPGVTSKWNNETAGAGSCFFSCLSIHVTTYSLLWLVKRIIDKFNTCFIMLLNPVFNCMNDLRSYFLYQIGLFIRTNSSIKILFIWHTKYSCVKIAVNRNDFYLLLQLYHCV